MSGRSRRVLYALVPAAVIALCFALGVVVGRRQAASDMSLARDAASYLADGMLMGARDPERRERMAQAYLDPARARAGLGDYVWAGFEVPTPFVGNAQYPGRWGSATINEAQMRSSRPLVLPKPAGVCRIFLAGGSTAFGTGAPDDESTIGGYLQSILNESMPLPGFSSYEVLTAANPAWSTTHERIFIVNRLSECEPDLVLSFSGSNDVHWGRRERNVLWFRANADLHFWSLFERILAATGHGPVREFLPEEPGPVDSELVSYRLAKNIRMSAYALRQKGVPYLYALQPNLYVAQKPFAPAERAHASRYDFDETDRDPDDPIEYFRRCYERLRADLPLIDEPNCRFVDLSPVFDDLDAGTVVFIDMFHFGDRGNEIVARALVPHVVELLRGRTH
jgi:hypothetical protein